MTAAALALDPGLAAQEAETPPLSELHRFLDLVLADGRYVLDFKQDPAATAHALGFDLSSEVAEEIAATPRVKLFKDLYLTKFAQPTMRAVWPALAVGIVIVVGAVVIVTAIAIVVYTKRRSRTNGPTEFVIDRSAHRESKV